MAMLNQRLCTSPLNLLSHVSSICFMAIESVGIHITPGSLLCVACHLCNLVNCLQRKSLWIAGIIGMCFNILWGGPCALCFFFIHGTCHSHILDTSFYSHMHLCKNIIVWACVVWYVLNTQLFQHFLCLCAVVGQAIISQKYIIFK